MNFFGHSVLAARRSLDPCFILGSMLPDFATMAQLRLGEVPDGPLADGVGHHHAVDGAFHSAPIFTTLMGDAMALFEAEGFGRGPARAGSHIGIELLLDGLLAREDAHVHAYRSALDAISSVPDLHNLQDGPRIAQLTARLREAPLPEGYASSDFVADRLLYILQGRPRLRLAKEQRPAILRCLERIQEQVIANGQALVDHTDSQLTSP